MLSRIFGRRLSERATGRSGGQPLLEIQYHPGDIRRGVRYFFLSRRQVLARCLGGLAWLVLVACGVTLAPTVIRNHLAYAEYQDRVAQRAHHGERLNVLVRRLADLEGRSDEVRLEMAQIYLAYGFSEEASRGKGGYPHAPAAVPQSIYSASIRRGNALTARIEEQMGVLEAFLTEVQSFEETHSEQVRTTPSACPLRSRDFVLTSPFGSRTSPFTKGTDFHAGIDLAAKVGTPVFAPSDALVTFAGRYPLKHSVGWWRYGNLVALRHGDRFISLFGHCDEIKVRSGQKVVQGEVIATVGNSGWSTNPHLHYEVRRFDDAAGEYRPIDPRIYILNHRWRDEERLLIRARRSPDARDYEPLPRLIRR